jgi:hypothetical protein
LVGLQGFFVDLDDAVGAGDAAAGAAYAGFGVRHEGVIVTFSVYFFCQFDDLAWAGCDAYAAAFATLDVNDDGSSEFCHIDKFLKLLSRLIMSHEIREFYPNIVRLFVLFLGKRLI